MPFVLLPPVLGARNLLFLLKTLNYLPFASKNALLAQKKA
jgi:hypothetical protein